MSPRPIIASFLCTLFWGTAGAAIAGIHMDPATLIAVNCLVQSPMMLLIAAGRGNTRRRQADTRWLAVIGVCSAVISVTYYASLAMAPPALAAALHLSAPLILVCIALARGRRRLDLVTVAILGLLLAGSSSGVLGQGFTAVSPHVLLGLGLALLSAAAIAVNATLVNRHGGKATAAWNSAISNGVCGLLFLPSLVVAPPTPHQVLVITVITVCCFVPAGLLSWWSQPRLVPTVATSIGLNEALVTGALAWCFLGSRLAPVELAGGAAILTAVVLEARRHTSRATTPAPPISLPPRRTVPRRLPQPRIARRYHAVTRPVRVRARARRIARSAA